MTFYEEKFIAEKIIIAVFLIGILVFSLLSLSIVKERASKDLVNDHQPTIQVGAQAQAQHIMGESPSITIELQFKPNSNQVEQGTVAP